MGLGWPRVVEDAQSERNDKCQRGQDQAHYKSGGQDDTVTPKWEDTHGSG